MWKIRKSGPAAKAAWAVGIGLAAALFALTLSYFRLFAAWELKTYDLRMQSFAGGRPEPQKVVMFYVDEDSLRFMEENGIRWPWPREVQASVLEFCRRGGARAVLFDIFFSEDSVYGVDDDLAFADGVKAGPPSYFVLFLSKYEAPEDQREAEVIRKSAVPLAGPYPAWMPRLLSMKSLPVPTLVESAAGFGNAQMPPDDDGTYRRISLVDGLPKGIVSSIPLKVASDVAGVASLNWPERDRFLFGETPVPLDRDGQLMVNYYGEMETFPNYPLAQVVASEAAVASGEKPDIDPSVVKDKIVIIGVAAPGLFDLKPTPLARVFPGPEVHATVIENLLTGDFISPMRTPAIVAVVFAAGLLAALGLAAIKSTAGMGAWFAGTMALTVGAGFALFWRGVWMPLFAPVAAAGFASFGMFVRHYLTEGKKKREIRRAFGQYLSPHVVGEIARDPERLKLGGALQEVTLFFSDIADFTSISERSKPEELVAKLNDYFSRTTRIIQERGGTLDKYIGDAIMAFWGAPLPVEGHAEHAILSALEIQKELRGAEFATRIGVHTGIVLVGNIGSDIRFNYTAIGDSVNLASRLEGLNKQFGTRIIASETAMLAAGGGVEARRVGKVRVKGRAAPIGIYEPLGSRGDHGPLGEAGLKEFADALALFDSARFRDAAAAFSALFEERGDPTAKIYAGVCERYAKDPPQGFDGVITFTTK